MACYKKLSLWLILMTTLTLIMSFSAASRPGDKIHFQDSSELGEFQIDERQGNGRGNRNHRGRARGHYKQGHVAQFEEALPGVYPIRGPPQAPFVLPDQQTTVQTPLVTPSRPNLIYQPRQPEQTTNQNNPYANNPFLANAPAFQGITTNKYNIPYTQGAVTNQLPSSDKPISTATPSATTPSYENPRRTDLLYGSNLLEEETEREAKSNTEITFEERGIFDSAPHCQPGQILVNNKCRSKV